MSWQNDIYGCHGKTSGEKESVWLSCEKTNAFMGKDLYFYYAKMILWMSGEKNLYGYHAKVTE